MTRCQVAPTFGISHYLEVNHLGYIEEEDYLLLSSVRYTTELLKDRFRQ